MPASPAQIAANRANALASTGPRTPEGKAASSRNALSHGAHASDDTILAAAPNAYLDSFRARFEPADPFEDHLVEHLAVLASRRDRLNAAVDALLELDERHALTECLHERYGVNQDGAFIPGQPSWQAAMHRYDSNTYCDPRHPEPVSDPALDPDPALCSLAYTLSSPRAAALFRHEAAVDRRFHAALKELTTVQARRRVTTAVTTPTAPAHEPRLNHALERYLRQTAAPPSPPFDPVTPPAPAPPAGNVLTPPSPDQSLSLSPDGQTPSLDAYAAIMSMMSAATSLSDLQSLIPEGLYRQPLPHPTMLANAEFEANVQDRQIEAIAPDDLPVEAESTIFRSVLPRDPAEPSSIPALWPDTSPPTAHK